MNCLQSKNNICVIIPFYNEEKTISKIIYDALDYVDLIIAVNDGSTDNSIQNIPQNEKIIVINQKRNAGKGAALREGFEKSLELNSKFTITLDADLQHDPKLIPDFIEKLNYYDLIIGKRKIFESDMPVHRRLSNLLTSKLLSLKTGRKILDSQSGFRAYKTEILKYVLPKFNGFEAESEMIVRICRMNYSVGYVDIPTIYGDDNSKMKSIPAIIGFIKVLFI